MVDTWNKQVNNSDSGDSTHLGGNNWDSLVDLLNGMSSSSRYEVARGLMSRFLAKRQIYIYWNGTGSPITIGCNYVSNGTASGVTDADGNYNQFASAASTNSLAGATTHATNTLRRSFNFDLLFKFRVNETANRRAFIGVAAANTDLSSADAPTANHVALRISSGAASANYVISSGNGSTNTISSDVASADTGIHTFRLVADDSNSKFKYSFDGGAFMDITSNIPASTTGLGVTFIERTTENVAKNLHIWYVEGWADK